MKIRPFRWTSSSSASISLVPRQLESEYLCTAYWNTFCNVSILSLTRVIWLWVGLLKVLMRIELPSSLVISDWKYQIEAINIHVWKII